MASLWQTSRNEQIEDADKAIQHLVRSSAGIFHRAQALTVFSKGRWWAMEFSWWVRWQNNGISMDHVHVDLGWWNCSFTIMNHEVSPWKFNSQTWWFLGGIIEYSQILNILYILVNTLWCHQAWLAGNPSWSKEVWKLNFRQYGELQTQASSVEAKTWRKWEERRCRCAKR